MSVWVKSGFMATCDECEWWEGSFFESEEDALDEAETHLKVGHDSGVELKASYQTVGPNEVVDFRPIQERMGD